MANFQRFWTNIRNQCRKVRLEFIAAPFFELVKKIRSPILVVNFQTVAKVGVRRISAERLDQSIANVLQITFARRCVEMIKHIAFFAHGGTAFRQAPSPGTDENTSRCRTWISWFTNVTSTKVRHAVRAV